MLNPTQIENFGLSYRVLVPSLVDKDGLEDIVASMVEEDNARNSAIGAAKALASTGDGPDNKAADAIAKIGMSRDADEIEKLKTMVQELIPIVTDENLTKWLSAVTYHSGDDLVRAVTEGNRPEGEAAATYYDAMKLKERANPIDKATYTAAVVQSGTVTEVVNKMRAKPAAERTPLEKNYVMMLDEIDASMAKMVFDSRPKRAATEVEASEEPDAKRMKVETASVDA